MTDVLEQQLIDELTIPVAPPLVAFAEHLVAHMPCRPLGVLFYGSLLRARDPDGIVDFYVIMEHGWDYPGSIPGRMANSLLPPNVRYEEYRHDGTMLRAKIAFLSYRQFLKRCGLESLDTTIWARFCQPVRLVWVRDTANADRILEALRHAVITASCWAALIGPGCGRAEEYWLNLFAHTYTAELRVERKDRARNLLKGQEERYSRCLLAAWRQARLAVTVDGEALHPVLSPSAYKKAARRWRRLERWGRVLNILRLLKAAFTFRGGMAYLLWKIRRHTGHEVRLSRFEHRHPILCLPLFLWRVRKIRS